MEENKQHFQHIMLYCFMEGKNGTEMQQKQKICAVYGEGAVTDQMCQTWFVMCHAGDFSLNDAPQLSRPVKVESDQIKALIEDNQCHIRQEIANILKISKSIKLLVKVKNVSFNLQKKKYEFFSQPNTFLLHYIVSVRHIREF